MIFFFNLSKKHSHPAYVICRTGLHKAQLNLMNNWIYY